MDGGWLVRLRWRRRGAWLWPAFVVMTVADGVIWHVWPPSGDRQSIVPGMLVGLMLNLLAVLFLSRPGAALLRRWRPDLPSVVARNYAGTSAVIAVSAAVLATGALHHATIVSNQSAMRDATARAQAWIGDRAPDLFRRDLERLSTFAIEPGSIYRTCAASADGRSYCVIVRVHMPFARSVRFDGYEPNSVFFQGLG
jgi:hypothetical protein